MTQPDTSKNDVPLDASIPDGAVPLESVLCTEELGRRPWRPPDHAKENRALVALASALAGSPHTTLQTLAETILDVTQSDSAGLSLPRTDDGGKRFYWPAIAGIWKPHIGSGTPRDFGPCGDVFNSNSTLLFRHLERRYTYFLPVTPPAVECLMVPFHVRGKAVGTIWALLHDDRRKYDAEDERLMNTLGQFASLAYQALASIDDLKFQIAEREKAQQGEDHLRLVVDTTPALIHTGRPDGYLDYFNQRWLEYLGLSLDDVCGWRWTKAIHPDDVEDILEKWRSALATGEPFEAETRVRRADGEYRRMLHRKCPLRDSHDKILKWYGSSLDIEDRRRAEERIRQDERELRQLMDFLPQHVMVLDSDGRLLQTNQMWLDYTGHTLKEMRGLETDERIKRDIHPDDLERALEKSRRGLLSGAPFDLERRALGKNGQYRWFLFRYKPMLDEAGRIARWFLTATDIEDRKREEEGIRKENIALREEIDKASMFEEIVGSSEALRKILLQVAKVASTDSTVLILGETGTGKELVARAIHRRSNRSTRAFIRVNCAAIPPALIASELFGHEKGAFTGALQRHLGRFESADGGTIFLDEVGELPMETQVALLRVLQEREFERVGGSESISVNVRVLAAANRDLRTAVAAGTFREDLFYRLNVFPIHIPPLRDRREDIPLLVEYMIERYGKKAGKKIRNINKATLDLFQAYDWPGNIRELQNVVERVVILCEGETFSVDETWLRPESQQPAGPTVPLVAKLEEHEKEAIESALAECQGRISGPSGAAAKLGIPRQTLESKIAKLGINRYRFKRAKAQSA